MYAIQLCFRGPQQRLTDELTRNMEQAAEQLEYEKAQRRAIKLHYYAAYKISKAWKTDMAMLTLLLPA